MTRWGWVLSDLVNEDFEGVFDAGENVRDDAVLHTLDALRKRGWHDTDHVADLLREVARTDKSRVDYWEIREDWKVLWTRWVWTMLQEELGKTIWETLLDNERESLQVTIGSTDHTKPSDQQNEILSPMSVSKYLEHIQSLIRDHAHRIGNARLGSGPLVRRDIEAAISQVWESMPSGHFG